MSLQARVEDAAARAWPPCEAQSVAGWLCRAGAAGTRRQNSVRTTVFDGGVPLGTALAEVEAWYQRRHLPPCFQLTPQTAPAGLDAALAARGYRCLTHTSVLVAPAASVAGHEAADIELLTDPTALVLQALADPGWSQDLRQARAELFARLPKPRCFALVCSGETPVAGGLAVAEAGLAGIFAMRTSPPWRRQGLAARVLAALAGWARSVGVETLYLQVEDANLAGRALYETHGFERCYGYWYRERPEPPG